MAVLDWTSFGEITVAITDEEHSEVRVALAGSESQHMLEISTREVAIRDLRAAADWLEGGEPPSLEEMK
jgi:hypothetical protein